MRSNQLPSDVVTDARLINDNHVARGSCPIPEIPRSVRKEESADAFAQICFTPGTLIQTPGGLQPIETLTPGDSVITRDNGPQTVRWAAKTELSAETIRQSPGLRPVILQKNSIGPGIPACDIAVSPGHRVLLDDWRAELLFGAKEVLATAAALTDGKTIHRVSAHQGATYLHILFERHEIIRANGIRTESFRPSDSVISALGAQARKSLLAASPGLCANNSTLPPARRLLNTLEARALRSA